MLCALIYIKKISSLFQFTSKYVRIQTFIQIINILIQQSQQTSNL